MTILTSGEKSTGLIQQGSVLRITSSTSVLVQVFDGDVEVDRLAVSGGRLIGPYYKNLRYRMTSLSGKTEYSVVEAGAYLSPAALGIYGVERGIYAGGEKIDNAGFIKNKLINVYPTLRASSYSGSGAQKYTAFNAGADAATIAADLDQIDPATGRPMAKVTIPALSTNFASIDFLDLDPWEMQQDDVWMFSLYLPNRLSGAITVMIYISDQGNISSNHRAVSLGGYMLQKGFNLISVKHTETNIGATQYGTVGTTYFTSWTDYGNNSVTSQSRSIRIHVKCNNGQADPTNIYVGSVHTAPAGWAKGAVMWSADDVPSTFYNLALPIIESYGWKCSLIDVATYATDFNPTYMNINNIRSAHENGHEIWGHLWRHEDITAGTTEEKTRALKNAAQMWRSIGINTAAQNLGWPTGKYDDTAIAIAKEQGYKLAMSTDGVEINPLIAGCNPFYLNRAHLEISNPWRADSILNGAIMRGSGIIPYMHNAVAGGDGINTYPGSGFFYVDHLRRWCDLVAEKESAGECVVTTPLDYFRLCGIDPGSHQFAE